MTPIDWRDIGIRALKTFAQAAIAALVAVPAAQWDDRALFAAAIAGIAAVLSFVQNVLLAKTKP